MLTMPYRQWSSRLPALRFPGASSFEAFASQRISPWWVVRKSARVYFSRLPTPASSKPDDAMMLEACSGVA